MTRSKTINIQLSGEDGDRLEAEADKLNISPDVLAHIILRQHLT